eukprot:CCRYP_001325-RA/>CCRYP_001325-RA protein AED:0.14 eAED:0.14 QI:58/1/1/1/1/1/6/206/240
MKTMISLILVLTLITAEGFIFPNPSAKSHTGLSLKKPAPKQGYVPKGFSPEGWALLKAKEERQRHEKKKHFKSRSLVDFQTDLETGKVRHLFPVMNAKERIKEGEIKPSDVPYEQRQGSYDNSDVNVGYVPYGMSVHEWHELQRSEKKELEVKEFGKIGPKGFMSRSLQAFQEDMEKGKVKHLFPVSIDGLKKREDIPYMRRGGNWDNSDVKGAYKLEWTDTDRRLEFLPEWLRHGPLAS